MDKIFCVEFQKEPLKFHIKYLTHTLKRCTFYLKVKNYELLDLRTHTCFLNAPQALSSYTTDYVGQVPGFYQDGFQQHAPSCSRKIIENADVF